MSSGVSPSVVASPTGDGNNAVKVKVTTNLPLLLARVLTTSTTLPVTATAYAEIKSDAPACVIALSGSGTGVTMNGGTNLTANNCAIASNNSLTLSGGAKLVTQNVDYGKTAPGVSGGASISAPSGKTLHENKVTTTDPLAPSSGSPGSIEVANATAHLGFNSSGACAGTSGTVCAITSPAAPTVAAGTAVSFGYSSISASNLPSNCADSWNSTAHTHALTCTGTGPFNFGAMSLAGGLSATITNTSSGATYNFSGTIDATSSNGLTFNGGSSATYNMAAGLVTGGAAPMTFSAGTFNIGKGAASCNSSTGYSICDSSSLTIGGPSTFTLAGGMYISGGSTLIMGTSGTTTNSYNIGAASDGNSIAAGAVPKQWTSRRHRQRRSVPDRRKHRQWRRRQLCLPLPAAAEHNINGSTSQLAWTYLGAGVYTITAISLSVRAPAAMSAIGRRPAVTTGLSALRRHPRRLGCQHRDLQRRGVVSVLSRCRFQHGQSDGAQLVINPRQRHRQPRGHRPAIFNQYVGGASIHHRGERIRKFLAHSTSPMARDHERRRRTP